MGRPRSARAHEQVLEAALELFAERGIDATSVDAISSAAGVSKATIYKHWPDKEALCLEAMAWSHGLDEALPALTETDPRAAMVAVLSRQPSPQQAARRKRLMPHFMAYAARHPAFGIAWRSRVMQPLRTHLKRFLKQAVAAGQLPSDLDYDLALALLIGPIMYGYYLTVAGSRVPKELPARVVDAFWNAFAVK